MGGGRDGNRRKEDLHALRSGRLGVERSESLEMLMAGLLLPDRVVWLDGKESVGLTEFCNASRKPCI